MKQTIAYSLSYFHRRDQHSSNILTNILDFMLPLIESTFYLSEIVYGYI